METTGKEAAQQAATGAQPWGGGASWVLSPGAAALVQMLPQASGAAVQIPPQVAAALVVAQRAVVPLEKAGWNAHHEYSYVTAHQLIQASRTALNVAGLALLAGPCRAEVRMEDWGERRVAQHEAVRELVLIHGESGHALRWEARWPLYLQDGKRPRDKALAVADTTMLGYALRDLLQIPALHESADDRDDSGHVDAAARESSRQSEQQLAAKQSAKPVAAAAASKPASKPAPAAGKPASKPAPAAAAAGKPTAAPEPATESGAEPAKRGHVPGVGQTYGEKAAEVGAAQRAALTPDHAAAEVRKALACGMTPATANGRLVVDLPPDPSLDDLVGMGWPEPVALTLASLSETEPVLRATVNDLLGKTAARLGLAGKAASERLAGELTDLGVDVAKKAPPNGYQLRLLAARVGQSCDRTTGDPEAPEPEPAVAAGAAEIASDESLPF